jgi:GNAT superfamily N-acetyltransferase
MSIDSLPPVLDAHPVTDPEAQDLMRELYESTFDVEQREPWAALMAKFRSGGTQLLGVWVDGAPIGFAIVYRLPRTQCLLVSHLAVAPSWRGRGVGNVLMSLRDGLIRQYGRGGMLLEIDDPDLTDDVHVARKSQQLQALYERLGAHVVCRTGYSMPNLNSRQGTLPLRLMWFPGANDPDRMTGEVLLDVIREIWERHYDVSPQDPRVRQVIAAVRSAIPAGRS